MNKFKSFYTTISGSISSVIPMLFTVCKSGACSATLFSPFASILGISSSTLIASPLTQSLFPLLLVISAVSFTVSYYKLYVLPKYITTCSIDSDCTPEKSRFQNKFSILIFWVGLVASITFFTYFEYQNYKASTTTMATVQTVLKTSLTNDKNENKTKETKKPCCNGDSN